LQHIRIHSSIFFGNEPTWYPLQCVVCHVFLHLYPLNQARDKIVPSRPWRRKVRGVDCIRTEPEGQRDRRSGRSHSLPPHVSKARPWRSRGSPQTVRKREYYTLTLFMAARAAAAVRVPGHIWPGPLESSNLVELTSMLLSAAPEQIAQQYGVASWAQVADSTRWG